MFSVHTAGWALLVRKWSKKEARTPTLPCLWTSPTSSSPFRFRHDRSPLDDEHRNHSSHQFHSLFTKIDPLLLNPVLPQWSSSDMRHARGETCQRSSTHGRSKQKDINLSKEMEDDDDNLSSNLQNSYSSPLPPPQDFIGADTCRQQWWEELTDTPDSW